MGDVTPGWRHHVEPEYVQHLEDEVERLREENAKLKASIAAATAEGYADGLHAGRQEARRG